MRHRLAVASLVLATMLLTAGCVEIVPARIPDRLLEGRGGNGWERNASASQSDPTSASFGFQKTQTLVYEDRIAEPGYPGVLVVSTLRTVPSPSGDRIREHVQETIRAEATKKGIEISNEPRTGTRTLANGERASWFVYTGNVSSTGGFFTRNAEMRIFGEVFECRDHRTVVASVGMAQTTDERRVGSGGLPGLPGPSERDTTTWRELVADPYGSIDGIRGSDGLSYHVLC